MIVPLLIPGRCPTHTALKAVFRYHPDPVCNGALLRSVLRCCRFRFRRFVYIFLFVSVLLLFLRFFFYTRLLLTFLFIGLLLTL